MNIRKALITLGTTAGISLSVFPGTAHAAHTTPEALEGEIDALVADFRDKTSTPGMTVAVSHRGRLVFTKGYGNAMDDGTTKLPMRASTRSSIGSISKAAITGPTVWNLMKKAGIDPATTKLYGPNGLYKGKFDADIDQGIAQWAPESASWKEWYEKITVQHLLDHFAGFQDSASKPKAAQMFGVSEDELTREQYHSYLLRRGKLLFEPGTEYRYSNVGFGSLALVVEQLSGRDFYEVVRDDYLEPASLHNAIQGSRENPDSCDSHNHGYGGEASSVKLLAFNESRLGLPQGGFRSSAQDLVRVMDNLVSSHSWDDIDRMGWREGDGALQHGGKLPSFSGGTAYARMYKDGHKLSGADMSRIHVAVAANITVQGASTGTLAGKIALKAATSHLHPKYDLWPQTLAARSCEWSRHAIPASEYQSVFDKATKQDYQLAWIDGYAVDDKTYYNAVFRFPGAGDQPSRHGMTGATYQKWFDTYKGLGYSLAHVDSYPTKNGVRYAAIWRKNAGPVWAYHGRSAAEHQDLFEQLKADGWRPRVISVVSVNGARKYTALYTRDNIGSWRARSNLTSEQYQQHYNANKAAGRRLRYVNAYVHDGKVRFTAIWASQPPVQSMTARHGATGDEYELAWKKNASAGRRIQALTGYDQNGKHTFAAAWIK